MPRRYEFGSLPFITLLYCVPAKPGWSRFYSATVLVGLRWIYLVTSGSMLNLPGRQLPVETLLMLMMVDLILHCNHAGRQREERHSGSGHCAGQAHLEHPLVR